MKTVSRIYIPLIFLMLYLPILVVIVFSFNKAGSLNNFSSFSLVWYKELFSDDVALGALKNSLSLALTSSLISTVIGTFAAFGINKMKSKFISGTVMSVTNIPMMNPDIVTGISMMLLFVAAMSIPAFENIFGRATMIIAHVTFSLPYVILSVLPRFKQMDKSLCDAALDLGCTPAQTFFKVELPTVVPGIISGLMLGFSLSLDDFVISHFVSSPDFQTLPLYIYNQTAHQVKYSMYALCSLMVFAILVLLFAVNFAGSIGKVKKTAGGAAK
ncbi:MAG: ABC transporter permease [Clostridiales bacterium]|nr:ABC transporter permease [Clostridiales bacterium]